jgi:hypothetical protein
MSALLALVWHPLYHLEQRLDGILPPDYRRYPDGQIDRQLELPPE